MILEGGTADAHTYMDRVRQWVFGSYTIELGHETRKVDIWASIGIAALQAGDTVASLVQRADADMYEHKRRGTRGKLASMRSA